MLALTSTSVGGLVPLMLAANTQFLHPLVLVLLCVFGAAGTILLLPGRRERAVRTIGGVILLAVLLIFVALLVRQTAPSAGDVYFWIFSLIAVISAVRVISHPRPVYSALYFVLTVIASAGLFVLLWAEFMAAALILIYAGAILVTYVFVIMLAQQAQAGVVVTGEGSGAEYDRTSREPVLATAVGFALMGLILFLIFDRSGGLPPAGQPLVSLYLAGENEPQIGSVSQLGLYLFTRQALGLELAGLLLTIGMVGAVVVARRQVGGRAPVHEEVLSAEEPSADLVEYPATPVDDNPHSIPVYGTRNPQAKAYPER